MLHAMLENAAAVGRAAMDLGLMAVGAAPIRSPLVQGHAQDSAYEALGQGDHFVYFEELGLLAPGGAIPGPGSPFLGDQIGLRWPVVHGDEFAVGSAGTLIGAYDPSDPVD